MGESRTSLDDRSIDVTNRENEDEVECSDCLRMRGLLFGAHNLKPASLQCVVSTVPGLFALCKVITARLARSCMHFKGML